MKGSTNHIIILFLLLLGVAYGQEGQATELLFSEARQMAFNGQHKAARSKLNTILAYDPGHSDGQTLLAKTYSWEGNYEEARKHLNRMTSGERENQEAWVAAIKNEMYAGNLHIALGLTNKALSFLPADPELIGLRSVLLAQNQKEAQAPGIKEDNIDDIIALQPKKQSWKGKYDKARIRFNTYTSEDPLHQQAWVGAINNEMDAGNLNIALGLANKALINLPGDRELLVLRAHLLKLIDPVAARENEDKITVAQEKKNINRSNRIILSNQVDVFDKAFDPMLYGSVEYVKETAYGKIIPRLLYSNRFNTDGLQYELEIYPRFSAKTYANLAYAYSSSPIFPAQRAGAEVFSNLPKGIEVSLGARYYDFKETDALVYTGSIGLYKGNYYISLRPYLTPQAGQPISFSGSLLARKYTRTKEDYWGIRAGVGYNTDLKQLRRDDVLLSETILFVSSQQLQLEHQFRPGGRTSMYRANLGLLRQEFAADPGNFFYAVSGGLQYFFDF
ncbi:YaiO family outer membrane beta-barrel protein [Zeaxanthinibacter enoshimensis]|uniref:YaiO family outer membrane protein n=1 Tax=Zeaxanthinibacter enoshimensis TaxID=392009 RepID=A0A4R6TL54_9FLAO|nr:YaiO family outer membrane beta-barrel protein [Zeaxanthinibacter enoshimensis]TDQ31417.1 YaiO family outer membrane protein [Zeaxanthinibacter enoshimensis]